MPKAAYCDVDGTLAATTIVTPLIWFKRRQLSPAMNYMWLASLGVRGPWWLLLDRMSRHASNRAIYSHYRGMPAQQVRARARSCFDECIRPRLYSKGVERLANLRAQGFEIVLVTGGLDFLMQPLAEHLQATLIAPAMKEETDGILTGDLVDGPLAGQGKADAIQQHAQKGSVDLKASCAFGDAFGDLPMLEAVGQPIAVNAAGRLARIAAARGWQQENWRS